MSRTSNLLQGLLQLADASGGEIETRIRLQKEAYLLAVAGYKHISKDSFSYHHYGPFSRELSDILQFAVLSGLLQEVQSLGGDGGTKYAYKLNAAGKNYLDQSGYMEPEYFSFVRTLANYHWRTLELVATAKFLEEKVGRAAALPKALELKPETAPFREKAVELLKQIAA